MITCAEITVKFRCEIYNSQAISAAEYRAKDENMAEKLRITRDEDFLTVDFLAKSGVVVKQIAYNVNDVREYSCGGIFNVHTVACIDGPRT